MTPFHRAGDRVRVLRGPEAGTVLEIASVRAFAADAGYSLRGGAGLYLLADVEFVSEHASGNPCGIDCLVAAHADLGSCPHCHGVCDCPVPETAVSASRA